MVGVSSFGNGPWNFVDIVLVNLIAEVLIMGNGRRASAEIPASSTSFVAIKEENMGADSVREPLAALAKMPEARREFQVIGHPCSSTDVKKKKKNPFSILISPNLLLFFFFKPRSLAIRTAIPDAHVCFFSSSFLSARRHRTANENFETSKHASLYNIVAEWKKKKKKKVCIILQVMTSKKEEIFDF